MEQALLPDLSEPAAIPAWDAQPISSSSRTTDEGDKSPLISRDRGAAEAQLLGLGVLQTPHWLLLEAPISCCPAGRRCRLPSDYFPVICLSYSHPCSSGRPHYPCPLFLRASPRCPPEGYPYPAALSAFQRLTTTPPCTLSPHLIPFPAF